MIIFEVNARFPTLSEVQPVLGISIQNFSPFCNSEEKPNYEEDQPKTEEDKAEKVEPEEAKPEKRALRFRA
jgi:hypothetical protein